MATMFTAVTTVEPVFTEPERLALAGFLAGYTGLTRETYALDLRRLRPWPGRSVLDAAARPATSPLRCAQLSTASLG
jgi:hypothetical protein